MNGNLSLYGSTNNYGSIDFYDSDKTHNTTLLPSQNVSVNITLPATAGTLALTTDFTSFITADSNTSFTNKSFC